ncbi:MAG: hypothetical protein ACFB0E_20320 [Leptolyngbyaceae cyanobacterium]
MKSATKLFSSVGQTVKFERDRPQISLVNFSEPAPDGNGGIAFNGV